VVDATAASPTSPRLGRKKCHTAEADKKRGVGRAEQERRIGPGFRSAAEGNEGQDGTAVDGGTERWTKDRTTATAAAAVAAERAADATK